MNSKNLLQILIVSGKLDENWTLDNGCFHQMLGSENFLANLKSYPPYSIKLRNGSQARGVQMSSASLNPKISKIYNVLHLPKLWCNLIALSQLSKENRVIVIINDNVLMLKDRTSGRLEQIKREMGYTTFGRHL